MFKRALIYGLLVLLFLATLGATLSLIFEPSAKGLVVFLFWVCVSYLLYKKVERSE